MLCLQLGGGGCSCGRLRRSCSSSCLEELKADLQDVKQLYKDQIEFMVEQLAHLTQQGYVSSPFRKSKGMGQVNRAQKDKI